ncbi:MAG: hypothetical protein AMXMBFR42_13630 [Burkholderiales bacterium]
MARRAIARLSHARVAGPPDAGTYTGGALAAVGAMRPADAIPPAAGHRHDPRPGRGALRPPLRQALRCFVNERP